MKNGDVDAHTAKKLQPVVEAAASRGLSGEETPLDLGFGQKYDFWVGWIMVVGEVGGGGEGPFAGLGVVRIAAPHVRVAVGGGAGAVV